MKRFLARAAAAALSLMLAAGAAGAQENRAGVFPPNEVDQLKVDKAIETGVASLKRNNGAYLTMSEHAGTQVSRCELVLYTYINSGVPESDPAFKQLFDDMMKRRMEATYCVALQAMVLEDLERVKHQRRIQMCAQFLVDNQNPEGMWGYGSPSIFVEEIPTEAPRKDVSSGGGGTAKVRSFDKLPPPGVKVKPTVKNKLKVEKKRDGTGNDNSNSQYAALGLRACHDSGIQIPAVVTDKSIEWWRKSQKTEKGALEDLIEGGVYGPEVKKGGTVASVTRKAEPNGWCYSNHGEHKAYGSMTAGATGSLAIYMYIKDNDEGKKHSWKNDKDIHEGLVWLAKNFSVTYNPGTYEHGGQENGQEQYYYYLYGLERAGMLYGTEVMGTHKWYPEGVKVLLANQKPDGSWGNSADETCFAILFLKRATKSLDVATGGNR